MDRWLASLWSDSIQEISSIREFREIVARGWLWEGCSNCYYTTAYTPTGRWVTEKGVDGSVLYYNPTWQWLSKCKSFHPDVEKRVDADIRDKKKKEGGFKTRFDNKWFSYVASIKNNKYTSILSLKFNYTHTHRSILDCLFSWALYPCVSPQKVLTSHKSSSSSVSSQK